MCWRKSNVPQATRTGRPNRRCPERPRQLSCSFAALLLLAELQLQAARGRRRLACSAPRWRDARNTRARRRYEHPRAPQLARLETNELASAPTTRRPTLGCYYGARRFGEFYVDACPLGGRCPRLRACMSCSKVTACPFFPRSTPKWL